MTDLLERLRAVAAGSDRPYAASVADDAIFEIERLQTIIDSRPAINAALPDSYIEWSQRIYTLEYSRAQGKPS